MFGHGLRGLPHHHNFTTRSTSKSCSGMGPSIQVDREIQRPSIGQNHRHHHTDDGVTTVTVLPTLNHETQPDTNSKTVQAQHQNLEHTQTTVTGVGITYRAMLKASIPDCTMAPRSITPPQSTTLPPSASKAPIHGFTTNFSAIPNHCQQLHLARFRQQGIVYCRVTTAQQLQRFTCIGSTKHTMTTRCPQFRGH